MAIDNIHHIVTPNSNRANSTEGNVNSSCSDCCAGIAKALSEAFRGLKINLSNALDSLFAATGQVERKVHTPTQYDLVCQAIATKEQEVDNLNKMISNPNSFDCLHAHNNWNFNQAIALLTEAEQGIITHSEALEKITEILDEEEVFNAALSVTKGDRETELNHLKSYLDYLEKQTE